MFPVIAKLLGRDQELGIRPRRDGNLFHGGNAFADWEAEAASFYRHTLADNPFRNRSRPYLYVMAIAVRQLGRLEAAANFENLLNVRQTDTDPLVRPTPATGGRWTTDVWAPLEGFMANVALRYRW